MGHVISLDVERLRRGMRYRWRCSCSVGGEWLYGQPGKTKARAEWQAHEVEMRKAK